VEETLRMVATGCELVRITAPSIKEAKNLENIRNELRKRGCEVPLVADIHFTPNAAEMAARIVEKVRVNPGNYADKKKFEVIEYTDASYQEELDRIREKFSPLVGICKEYGTAMRIGTNHGSLSDRIMSRYGDTPLGMVESALEFIRICEDMNYHNLVISMKSSNTQVMVQAYRLLVNRLELEGLQPYPLHLGVTEAGEAEDGRIKSAVGIGTLLEDGLGDTVRVSLTEPPEVEAPVARVLTDRYHSRTKEQSEIDPVGFTIPEPYTYHRRETTEVANFGASNVPRVISDISHLKDIVWRDLKSVGHFYLPELDKWKMNDVGTDYLYAGSNPVPFMLPNGLKQILDYSSWLEYDDHEHAFPLLKKSEVGQGPLSDQVNFLLQDAMDLELPGLILNEPAKWVVVLETKHDLAMQSLRRFFFELHKHQTKLPVVVRRSYAKVSEDQLMMFSATDVGGLLIDGFGDGIMLSQQEYAGEKATMLEELKNCNSIAFGILQAARTRMTKTEYISCPSCGRTLFDLQETTAMIRKRTDHLKGVKIGIMGCIVNGPGEMADADYGYVGSGKGKITLYKGQEVVKRGVPSSDAVNELIEIIREDGRWIEPEVHEEMV
ncbi:MAG: (E)-4-hydroxy-3-methylbut-2-enyl-diphosphate synthase, partial [Bacteroidota bacterium]